MAWNGYSETGQGSEERGPATYSFNPQAAPKQQVSLGTSQLNAGQRGGGVQGGLARYNEHSNGTAALSGLLNIAADKLAPVAKKMTEQAYLDGMTRAAAGQEMTTIINERPWFTKIFGDTPVVEGARAYKAQEATALFQASSMERMAELRKLPPESMSNYVREQFDQYANTGDPDTDRLIKNSIAQVTPDFVRTHTREHVKYMQEQLADQQLKAWDATSTALQTTLSSEKELPPELLAEAKAGYLASLAPPSGMTEEAHLQAIEKHVAFAAERGNFHAVRALEESGAMAHLPMERRMKLEPLVKKAELMYASTKGMAEIQEEYLKARHDVQMGRATPEEVLSWMKQKSEDYRKRTGSSVGLFTLDGENSMVSSAQSARAALLAADAAAWEKAQAAKQVAVFSEAAIRQRNPDYASERSGGLLKKTDAQDMAYNLYMSSDRNGRMDLMVNWALDENYQVPKAIKADLARSLNLTNPDHITPTFLGTAALFQDLRKKTGGATAVSAWFDKDDYIMLDTFIKGGGMSGDPKMATAAYEVARREVLVRGASPLNEADSKEVKAFLADKTSRGGFFFDWTKTKANPGTMLYLETLMGNEVKAMKGTLTGSALHEDAWRRVSEQVQPLGSYLFRKSETQTPLDDILNKRAGGQIKLNADVVSEGTDNLIAERLDRLGVDVRDSQVHLIREADRDGVAQFTVLAYTDTGLPTAALFTSDDLYDSITKAMQANLSRIHKSNARNRRNLASEQAEERYQRELNKRKD